MGLLLPAWLQVKCAEPPKMLGLVQVVLKCLGHIAVGNRLTSLN